MIKKTKLAKSIKKGVVDEEVENLERLNTPSQTFNGFLIEDIIINKKNDYINELYKQLMAKQKREDKLKKKFEGVSITKHYKGKTLKNKFGQCYKISNRVKFNFVKPNLVTAKKNLLFDLKIISGISDITEINFQRNGIKSISDLINHHRYGNEAITYINHVKKNNAKEIYRQLESRFTSTNTLLLSNSALFDLSEIAIIDIETLGLTECPLFLIGIATFDNAHLIVDQIFVRELNEEKAALHFLEEHLKDKKAIITFNGKSFDIPFIRKRMERFDLKHDISHPHFDLMWLSKKIFLDVSGFSLSIIEEEIFNLKRKDDVSGAAIPSYYMKYLRSKNICTIVPIIDHNKQDLITTANIFMKLHEICHK